MSVTTTSGAAASVTSTSGTAFTPRGNVVEIRVQNVGTDNVTYAWGVDATDAMPYIEAGGSRVWSGTSATWRGNSDFNVKCASGESSTLRWAYDTRGA